ncbi:alpha-1,3-arabinosyltransferase XAT2-like [Carex rostrata]
MNTSVSLNLLQKPGPNNSTIEYDEKQSSPSNEKTQESSPTAAESSTTQPSVPSYQGQEEASSKTDSPAQNTGIICEFSDYRYNMCSIEVNLKVMGSSATVLLIPPSLSTTSANTTVWKIRPFTRKWEESTMAIVKELTIQWASDQNQGPACDVTHDVPVLIFPTALFSFNLFHDYTDLLLPLFVAANQYNGKIQFAVTNFHWPWIKKFMPHLQALSHYPIINLDSETLVHCFPSGQIGLRATFPMTVDNYSAQNVSTMVAFRHFVRTSLSLERTEIDITDQKNSNKKPRIAILLRKVTRTFTNENEIVEMAKEVGFEVVRTDAETTKDFPRIAHLINSCDVLMGLHGAGLTNMMYLPNNATLIQVIPWGDLRLVSWKDFGEPTKYMGLNYIEYEIKEEESTLIEKYPRNHTVFTNPQELHKQGWTAMYSVYLVQQSVKLNVNRFRAVLVDLFNSLTQQTRKK